MEEFDLTCDDFNEGEEIPKKFGYKHGNEQPQIFFGKRTSKLELEDNIKSFALIMDDPDAIKAVGKVWVHWLQYHDVSTMIKDAHVWWATNETVTIEGKTDFGEIGYGGPAPPDGRHTYVFKGYALDTSLNLTEGYSKQELEDAMKGHIIAEAKLTGTFAP